MKFRLPLSGLWMLRGSLEEMQWSTFISFSVQNHPLKQCKLRLRKGRGVVDVSGASVHHFDGFTMNSLWSILFYVESISRRIASASLA